MAIYLREDEVDRLVGMAEAMRLVEEAWQRQGEGLATLEPRRRVRAPGGALHVMFAADPRDPRGGVLGLKSYTSFPGRGPTRFHVLLYSADDGRLLAMLEAARLGQLRTGAASGVATRRLARPDAAVLALFGAGYQAYTQLEAVARARDLSEARVYCRDAAARKAFCDEMCARLGLWVFPAESPEAAIEGADIVCTITTSPRPVFPGERLPVGSHVNLAGSNSLLKREADETLLSRAALIAVDSPAAVPLEGGDLLPSIQKGLLYPEALVDIGQVVTGRHPGRTAADEITVFKSHGTALEDIALAAHVYRRAVEEGLGTPLPA